MLCLFCTNIQYIVPVIMFLFLFLLLLPISDTLAFPWDPKVTTSNGVVEGFESNNVLIFHSIPFAQPPVGRLRFRPPVYPAAPWSGVKDAKSQPNVCPQLKATSLFHMGKEDCLAVHVYVPKSASTSSAPLPVLYWIFGGGYSMGDGFQEGLYAGSTLSKAANAIVVAVNYRVGPFGFLSHDALQREDEDGSTGNMGVRDQQAGLLWVRDNIQAFGGDPSRVTIFGESAGGFSVCWHLASAHSKGLFSGAIVESGSCDAPEFFRKVKDQNEFGAIYSDSIGCNHTKLGNNDTKTLECLRNLKTVDVMNGVLNWFNPNWPEKSDLQQKFDAVLSSFGDGGGVGTKDGSLAGISGGLPGLAPVMPWGPVIDGTDVGTKDLPLTRLRNGQGNYVPTIWGSNLNEGTIFVPLIALIVKGGSYPLNALSLNLTLLHFFDNNETMMESVLELYPLGDYKNSQNVRAASILRDCFFSCAMRRGARAMDKHGSKAWLYHFEFPMNNPLYPLLGNFHASELGFVFGSWINPFSSKSHDMSASFQRYWGNLANSGDVNVDSDEQSAKAMYRGSPSRTFWPNHNASTDFNIVMDTPTSPQQHLYTEKCAFWDANMKQVT